LAAFGGGVVLMDPAGNVIGAVGVSGGTVEQDERIALAVLEIHANNKRKKEKNYDQGR